jgi:hypothetical protein
LVAVPISVAMPEFASDRTSVTVAGAPLLMFPSEQLTRVALSVHAPWEELAAYAVTPVGSGIESAVPVDGAGPVSVTVKVP